MSLLGRPYRFLHARKMIAFLFLTFSICPSCFAEPKNSKYGGQIVFSTTSDPKTFNEVLIKDASSSEITATIFEGLTTSNPDDARPEPNLAESWEVSPDGLTWIFHLRKDVLWNDGVPFTADDVVFTYNELIYNEEIPSSSANIFTIEGKKIAVEKIDDHTVRFILPVKFAPFLRAVGTAILPKHKLKQYVDNHTYNYQWTIDTPPQEIVGTGAFKLSRYEPGQRIVLVRNEHYWKKSAEGDRLPYIDKIIYIILQSSDVVILKFIEGTIDYNNVRGADYPMIKPLESKGNFTVYDMGPDDGSQFLFFNQNSGINPETKKPYVDPVKFKWFSDINFRRAVAHAIDKNQIIAIVKNGLGYEQDSPIGPGGGFFHKPDVVKYEFNLEKARTILKEAGYFDRDGDGIIEDAQGRKVEFNLFTNSGNTERVDIAGIIRSDLERIGMKVNFQSLEFNTLVQKINSTFEWDAIILGLTGGIEPHFGKNVWSSDGELHMWYPRQEKPATPWEKRIDEIFSLGVQELDENKRKEYYNEFQDIVAKEIPLIYTVLSAKLSAVRNKFGNLRPTNLGGVFHNLEEIYIKEEYR